MRKGGGKQKGASFEREICRELSLWMSGGKQEDVFWRSAMSGGRSTVAFGKGKRLATQAGDISCIHFLGIPLTDRFLVECKSYANLNFLGLLTGKGRLATFWRETKDQAKKYNKQPLLIAKQNHILPIVCMGFGGAEMLGLTTRSLLIAPRCNLRIIPLHEFLPVRHEANMSEDRITVNQLIRIAEEKTWEDFEAMPDGRLVLQDHAQTLLQEEEPVSPLLWVFEMRIGLHFERPMQAIMSCGHFIRMRSPHENWKVYPLKKLDPARPSDCMYHHPYSQLSHPLAWQPVLPYQSQTQNTVYAGSPQYVWTTNNITSGNTLTGVAVPAMAVSPYQQSLHQQTGAANATGWGYLKGLTGLLSGTKI